MPAMLRSLLILLTAAYISIGIVSAAPEGEYVGRWNPQPFVSESNVAYMVTQESPAARRQSRSRTAAANVFYLSPDGAILRVAKPNAILAPRGARAAADGGAVFTDVFLPGIMYLDANGALSRLYSGSPLRGPKDLAFDGNGDLVVADFEGFARTRHQGIYLWDRATRELTAVHRGPPLVWPHGIDVDRDGSYVVADHFGSIFRVTPSGQITTVASGAQLVAPQDIKVQADGSYVVTDIGLTVDIVTGMPIPPRSRHPGRLFRVSPDGNVALLYEQARARFRAVSNHPDGGWVVVNMGDLRPSGDHTGSLIRVYPDGEARIIHTGAPFYQPAGVAVIR